MTDGANLPDRLSVGVAGFGVMGQAITWCLLRQHWPVVVWSQNADQLTSRVRPFRRYLETAQLRVATSLGDLADNDFILEAVVEDLAVKRRLLAQLDGLAPETTVLLSNTSSLSIAELAMGIRRVDRLIGLHFFNPPQLIPFVEVTPSPMTSAVTLEKTLHLAALLKKEPLLTRDTPGFVVNRLLMPMINDAAYLVHDGVSNVQQVDSAMQRGTGWPMGPLAMADLIGLDVCRSILEQLHQRAGTRPPCPLFTALIVEGRLGRKQGGGFYR